MIYITGITSFIVGAIVGALVMYNNKKAVDKKLSEITNSYEDMLNDIREEKKDIRNRKDKLENKLREVTVKAKENKKSYKATLEEIIEILKK